MKVTLEKIEKDIEKLALQEQLRLMGSLVSLLKKELSNDEFSRKTSESKIVFAIKKSDVIGSLTREEISAGCYLERKNIYDAYKKGSGSDRND